MLLSELNLRALGVSASSVLPMVKTLNVEGRELEFKITAFASGFGSGKKSVISGSIKRADNSTEKVLQNADIEKIRRVCASLCELTQSGRTSERKPRTPKEQTEVEKLRVSLAVARRLCPYNEFANAWLIIDAPALRAHFKLARKTDRDRAKEALKARAVNPLLAKIEKLSAEERALLLASLQ